MKLFTFISLSVTFLTMLSSCTGGAPKKSSPFEMKRRQVDEYFVSSGVIRYFLPEVPHWANFSATGGCRRVSSIKYLDMKKIRNSLSLTHEESIQLQLTFNSMLEKKAEEAQVKVIPFKDQEALFFQASESIQAGIRTFRTPKFKRVNILWVDPFLSSGRDEELGRILRSNKFSNGHPIFLSVCQTRKSLNEILAKNSLLNKNIRLLTYELMTPFNLKDELDTDFSFHLDVLLKKKNIHFYYPRGESLPDFLQGKFKKHKI